jgi:superfamily II DNA or RNA helicase
MVFNDYLIKAIDNGYNWASKYLKKGSVPLKLVIEDARKNGVPEELCQKAEERGMITGDIDMTYEGAERIYKKVWDAFGQRDKDKQINEECNKAIAALDPVADHDLIANLLFCHPEIQEIVGKNVENLYKVMLTVGSRERKGYALPVKRKQERNESGSVLSSDLEALVKTIPRQDFAGDEEYNRRIRVILRKKAEREAFYIFRNDEHNAFKLLGEKIANESNENLRELYYLVGENYKRYFELEIKNLNPDFQDPETGKIGVLPSLHQRSAIYHLTKDLTKEKRFGVFDGCGTGKTAIAVLAQSLIEEELEKQGRQFKRTVVVCPNSTKSVWKKGLLGSEKERYLTNVNENEVMIINGENKNEDFIKELSDKKWIVLNYEQLTTKVNGSRRLFADVLAELGVDYLIFDESHHIKNKKEFTKKKKNSVSGAARTLAKKSEYLCLMSGSPIPDKMDDFAVMHSLLNPNDCSDAKEFKKKYRGNPRVLYTFFNEKAVRRTSEEINDSLEWEEFNQEIELDPVQQQLYNYIVEKRPKNWLTHARKALLDPRIVDPEIMKKAGVLGKVSYANSAKYKKLVDLLSDEDGPVKNGEKFVIFSSMFREGVTQKEHQSLKESYEKLGLPEEYKKLELNLALDDIVKKALEEKFGGKFKIGVIDGTVTSVNDREETVKGLDNGLAGILCTTDTGGESIDLTSASYALFLDEDYCPKTAEQALARLVRKGQDKKVRIQHLRGKGTLDEQLKDYVAKKELIIKMIVDGCPLTDEELALLDDTEGKKFVELVKGGYGGISIDVFDAKIDDTDNFEVKKRSVGSSKGAARLNRMNYDTTDAQKLDIWIGKDPNCWQNPEFVKLYLKTLPNLAVPVIHMAKICDLIMRAKAGEIEFPKIVLSEGSGPSILYNAYGKLSPQVKACGFDNPVVVDRDLSMAMLRNGANPNKILGCMTGKDSALKDCAFSMIDNESISLLKNPEEVKSSLLEANRILKPNGLVELIVKNWRFNKEFYSGMEKLGFEVLSEKNSGFGVSKEFFSRLREDYGEHFAEAYASKLANTHLLLARKKDKPAEADAGDFWFERTVPLAAAEEIEKAIEEGKEKEQKVRLALPGEIPGLRDGLKALIPIK